jgi:hypothetical protein
MLIEEHHNIKIILYDSRRYRYEGRLESDRRGGRDLSDDDPGDANFNESQELLKRIKKESQEAGAKVEPYTVNQRDGRKFFDGGIAGHIVSWVELAFPTTAAAAAFLGGAKTIVVKWLENRKARSISIKDGSREIKISGRNDVGAIIEALRKLEPPQAPKQEPPSDHGQM